MKCRQAAVALAATAAWCRMLWFHVRQFARVGYFVQLMVVGTVSAVIIQRLAAGSGGAMGFTAWVRAAEIGLWTTCTASGGMLGFQRFQGTLVPLLLGRTASGSALSALVTAAAAFGVGAFPLAASLCALMGAPVLFSAQTFLGIVIFWLGSVAASLVIASVFVLSPYATTYEALILVPLLLFSGILGFPGWMPNGARLLALLVPFGGGAGLISGSTGTVVFPLETWSVVSASLASILIWFALAKLLVGRCLDRARVDATLEVM